MPDVDPLNPPLDAAQPSGPLERLTFLDQWLARRITEAESAEARLEQRLAQVTRAEQALRGLSDSLRQQVVEAGSILRQVEDFARTAKATAHAALAEAQAQFDHAGELARSRIELVKDAQCVMEERLQEFARQAREVVEPIEKSLAGTLEAARRESRQIIETLPRSVAARLEIFRADVDRAIAQASAAVDRKLDAIAQRAAAAEHEVEDRCAGVPQRIEAAFQAHATRARAGWEEQIATALHDVGGQCDALRQRVEAAAEEAQAAVRRSVQDLCHAGEEAIVSAEQRVQQRMSGLRPQALAATEEAERLMSQRMQRMVDNLRAMVDLHETQLANKVEALRPRASAAARMAEAELAAKLAKLEQDAGAMTCALEKKLTDRIDELARRGRRVLRGELSSAEAAAAIQEELERALRGEPAPSVEVYVERPADPARAA